MQSRPELFIARRLNPSQTEGRPTPVGVRIGVTGIALAYVIMLLSLAIVTGFKQEIQRKVLGYESQIIITGRESDNTLTPEGTTNTIHLTEEFSAIIKTALGDVSVAGIADMPVLFKTDSTFSALILRCVDRNYDRDFINSSMIEGKWEYSDSASSRIAISRSTANELGLKPGATLFAHFFRNGTLLTRRLTVGAIYDTHFDDYDTHFAFGEIGLAKSVLKIPNSVYTSLAVNGLPDDIPLDDLTSQLTSQLVNETLRSNSSTSNVPVVKNINQTGALYLNWLRLLDTNVVVIIILMSVVAGFTLVSSLFILILERVSMIGLLKAIGATNRQIRGIFIWLAEKIVLRGLAAGNLVGLSLYFVQHWFHVIPLNPEAYYLSYVPTSLSLMTVIILNIGVITGSMLILILPTHIITRMSPTQSLRRHNESDE